MTVRQQASFGQIDPPEWRFYEVYSGCIRPGESATVKWLKWTGSAYTESDVQATVYGDLNIAIGAVGSRGVAIYCPLSKRWQAIGPNLALGQVTTSSHLKDEDQAVTIYAGAVGSEATTTFTVSAVENKFADLMTVGSWVIVGCNGENMYLIAGEC